MSGVIGVFNWIYSIIIMLIGWGIIGWVIILVVIIPIIALILKCVEVCFDSGLKIFGYLLRWSVTLVLLYAIYKVIMERM